MSEICVCCGPAKGKSGGFLARPDHHRGQAGYVLLILYLTKTQSIVIHSPVSSASVVKKRGGRKKGITGPLVGILNLLAFQRFTVSCASLVQKL